MTNFELYQGLMNLVETSEDDSFFFTDHLMDETPYRIFNYRLVNYTTFTTNPYAPYARGIMFELGSDKEYKALTCLPMNKFFNYAEGGVLHDSKDTEVLAIHEKLDGSLISSYIYKGQLKLKSKGSISSDQALAAMEFLSKPENISLYSLVYGYTSNGFTVNLEWTSPENRIVIGYEKDSLRILNIRDLVSHDIDLFFNKKEDFFAKDAFELLDKLRHTSLTKLVDDMYLEEQGEGYVLTMKNLQGLYQVKVKNHKYCDLHHLKDSINSQKALFSLVIKGQTDDLIEAFVGDQMALNIIKDMEDNLILSNTNLSKKYRNKLLNSLIEHGYKIKIKVFNPPLNTLLERDFSRLDKVGTRVIVDSYQKLQPQLKTLSKDTRVAFMTPPLITNQSDKCVIVDLDGTIAHIKDNYRTHFEADCGQDIFDELVFNMAYATSKAFSADLVFLTGRSSKAWESSKRWLDFHIGSDSKFGLDPLKDYQLYSRPSNDYRKDTIVKKELYDAFVKDVYSEVLCVFDDRPMMVNMWNDLGLKVIALGDQRKDF